MDFEILTIYNHKIDRRQQAVNSGGMFNDEYPDNYDTTYWEILTARRLKDDAIFVKDQTQTNKGKVMKMVAKYLILNKERKKIVEVHTALGIYNLLDLEIIYDMPVTNADTPANAEHIIKYKDTDLGLLINAELHRSIPLPNSNLDAHAYKVPGGIIYIFNKNYPNEHGVFVPIQFDYD